MTVTIELSSETVERFKRHASKTGRPVEILIAEEIEGSDFTDVEVETLVAQSTASGPTPSLQEGDLSRWVREAVQTTP